LAWIAEAKAKKESVSVGLLGNAAEIYPEILRRGIVPDIVTDQTSAHDLLYGYIPACYSLEDVRRMREENPEKLQADARLGSRNWFPWMSCRTMPSL
jgi:urocanate hydratase